MWCRSPEMRGEAVAQGVSRYFLAQTGAQPSFAASVLHRGGSLVPASAPGRKQPILGPGRAPQMRSTSSKRVGEHGIAVLAPLPCSTRSSMRGNRCRKPSAPRLPIRAAPAITRHQDGRYFRLGIWSKNWATSSWLSTTGKVWGRPHTGK